MGKKKYNTEEERKAAHREADRRYRQNNKDKEKERKKRWRETHKEEIKEYSKCYRQTNKEVIKKRHSEYYQKNKEKASEYYQKNRDKRLTYNSEYYQKKFGRATMLLNGYRTADKEHNRGVCTLTAEWILEHIFSGQCCTHCGETDWHKLGCNRLDNSKPHTPDNVEPCCWECNDRIYRESLRKTVYQYTLDGEFVREWESANECGRNGYETSAVASCCRGVRKTHKGYIWRYKEEVA